MHNHLRISGLNKTYTNGVKALDNVTLTIKPGMFGLLGPNGAGKSTLMRTLATLQEVDGGDVRLGELDVLKHKDEVRRKLGYLPQEFGVYPKVSAVMLLDHLALLKGYHNKAERKEMVDYLLQKVNLFEHRKKAVSSYSGGMRQRFGIAQCLIGSPDLVIVDEPTAGLDPGERNRFYTILSEIGEQTIVLLSTHIVQDVRELCTQMAIMNQGCVLFEGSTDEALTLIRGKVFEKQVGKQELEAYQTQYRVLSTKMVGGMPRVHVLADDNPGDGFTSAPESLEDVYFAKLSNVI
jgi:ABC-type multidrug transport system ATPase subunit